MTKNSKIFESAKRVALFDGGSASASGALNFEWERERERRSLFWARARARAALPKGRERAIVCLIWGLLVASCPAILMTASRRRWQNYILFPFKLYIGFQGYWQYQWLHYVSLLQFLLLPCLQSLLPLCCPQWLQSPAKVLPKQKMSRWPWWFQSRKGEYQFPPQLTMSSSNFQFCWRNHRLNQYQQVIWHQEFQ